MRRHELASWIGLASLFLACGGKLAPEGGSNGGSSPGSTNPTDGSCPNHDAQYCPSDEPVTYDDIAQCNQELADPACGASYKAFLACAEQHITCNANGMTDGDTIIASCENQLKNYEQCADQSPAHP